MRKLRKILTLIRGRSRRKFCISPCFSRDNRWEGGLADRFRETASTTRQSRQTGRGLPDEKNARNPGRLARRIPVCEPNLVGALIISVVRIGMTFLRVNIFAQNIVFGAVLIGAVAITIDRTKIPIVK